MTKVKLMDIVIEEMDREFTCTVSSSKFWKSYVLNAKKQCWLIGSLRRRQSKSPKNIEFSLGSRIINVIDYT